MSGENHTVVAAALKLYLRDLNDPIVPTILFDKIAAALSKHETKFLEVRSDLTTKTEIADEETMNAELKSLMDILPPDCYTILARLFGTYYLKLSNFRYFCNEIHFRVLASSGRAKRKE